LIPFALNDPHYRVRWAAVDVFAYLAQAFEPDFSNDFSEPVFNTLLACMQPANHWRVVANSCLALPDICRVIDKEHLVPYMGRFLQALVPLLALTHPPKVVENALAAVSTIAAVAETDFTQYYDTFMPGVKGLIMTCTAENQKHIRKKAIELIGMMAQAVHCEKFRPELEPIMEALLTMLSADMSADDPQRGEIVTTMARICRSVKQEFVPYLPRVIPSLLVSARIDDACVIVNEGEHNAYHGRDGWNTCTIEARATGKQQLSRNTTLLEEKALAIRMLFEYCNTLGGSFLPYVKEAADILIPCVRYQFNSNVRENSIFSLPPLMRCVKEGLASDPARQVAQCTELFAFMWPQVIVSMKVEADLECLGDIVIALREVVEAITPVQLTSEQIDELNELIYRLVGELLVRCQRRDEHTRTEDYDEAQEELFAMENEAEDEFLSAVYSLINALVKNGRDTYLTSFHQHLNGIFSAMMVRQRDTAHSTQCTVLVPGVLISSFCRACRLFLSRSLEIR
jgi:hypothetical protein